VESGSLIAAIEERKIQSKPKMKSDSLQRFDIEEDLSTGYKESLPKGKRSYYNIKIVDPNIVRLFNYRTGALIEIDKNDPAYSRFEDIWKKPVFNLHEHEWLSALRENGFVVPAELDEIEDHHASFQARQQSSSWMALIVMPTEECNFRCVYCYEDFTKGTMSTEIQIAVTAYIRKLMSTQKSIRLEWFGGEPFFAPEVIERISEAAIKSAGEYGVAYWGSATSNGYLITPNIFDISVSQWRIMRHNISIDGPKQYHDERRVLRNGGTTYDQILSNLEYMVSTKYEDVQIVIRMNVDRENIGKLFEFMETIKKVLGDDKRFYFYSRGVWGKSKFPLLSQSERRRLYKETARFTQQLNLRWYDPEIYLNTEMSICYAARPSSVVIGSDGKLYKCTADFSMPENQLGQLRQNGEAFIDLDMLQLWTESRAEKYKACWSCRIAPLCNGVMCPKVEIEGLRNSRTPMTRMPCPEAKFRVVDMIRQVHTSSENG
jgi:uncharacterized protein